MYQRIIDLLQLKGIEFDAGLTIEEIIKVEEIYDIQFPKSLREFFMVALPISKGFYNWRNVEDEYVNYIKKIIMRPIESVYELAEEVYWCDEWGDVPKDETDITKVVRERLKKAPKLIPIYAHRYIPMILDNDPPILSIHDIDIIYYGKNLVDYFEIEFGNKKQEKIEFQNINPVPFWSDIM